MTLASTGGRGVVDLLLLYCCLVEPLLLGGLLVEQCREWSSGPTTLREGPLRALYQLKEVVDLSSS